ncbi:tropinone reductase-like protein isoform X1 [Cinnamomum micranthum f. kanehirae]|uniref:Tropinone reductase-like protein isoform X1 n=1 Tax=Cinnamomum micranthum f. kanehirae TaxID=337451 RepID=A0A3S3MQM6_9MAGN|nr:tropinone reductase-like protein isoform X1 [Cinnamomum micranthum f. kanehirae]
MESRNGRWSLQGATALVTGGTRGIGKANLDRCLHEWEGKGFHVSGSVCDVSSRAERERLMEEVTSIFSGQLNILVNNAGITIVKPTVDYTTEELSTVMATNFDSAYHLCQLAHPLLKLSGRGNIVFISSTAGMMAIDVGSIYSASKGAMNQLTRNLACEWAKDNIRVNSIAPWFIKTAILDPFYQNSNFEDHARARTPLRRIGEVEEVSSMVAFLCLPAASYITGQVHVIDGGATINAFYPTHD